MITNLPNYADIVDKIVEDKPSKLAHYPTKIDDLTLQKARKEIVLLLSACPITIDMILEQTDFDFPTIYTILLELELAGRITRLPGNKFTILYN